MTRLAQTVAMLGLGLALACGADNALAAQGAARWGTYVSPQGESFVFGAAPGGAGAYLFQRATNRLTLLTQDSERFCDPGCAHRVSFTPGGVLIGLPGRSELRVAQRPIEVEDFDVDSGGVTLRGRLWRPTGPGPHPAVVLLGGTGCDLRDDFRVHPYLFVEAGYAVVAYDKRGCGQTVIAGRPAPEGVAELTNDALAAVSKLRAQARIDGDRIGVLGISHGAWVAAEAARRDPRIAFEVLIVGGGVPLHRALAYETSRRVIRAGGGPSEVAAAEKLVDDMFAALRAGQAQRLPEILEAVKSQTWFKSTSLAAYAALPPDVLAAAGAHSWAEELSYDPAPALRGSQARILAIGAEHDDFVPTAENLAAIRAARRTGVKTVSLKGADHGQAVRRDATGFNYADGLWSTLTAWLATASDKPGGRRARR